MTRYAPNGAPGGSGAGIAARVMAKEPSGAAVAVSSACASCSRNPSACAAWWSRSRSATSDASRASRWRRAARRASRSGPGSSSSWSSCSVAACQRSAFQGLVMTPSSPGIAQTRDRTRHDRCGYPPGGSRRKVRSWKIRAFSRSRCTVRSETPCTAAISTKENPQKNFRSTTWPEEGVAPGLAGRERQLTAEWPPPCRVPPAVCARSSREDWRAP